MWSDIKKKVLTLDSNDLVNLVGELYRLTGTNQNFLNTRFGHGVLKPYLDTIDGCMYPTANRLDVKVALAKRAISEYLKAMPTDYGGEAELKTYFIERGTEFCIDYAYFHEPLCQAFLRMYISAIDTIQRLPLEEQGGFRQRLKVIATSVGEIDETFEDAFREQYENSFP